MLEILKDHPKDQPVPAISLRQPWAGAVAWLGKDVENRGSWPSKYRGPILIHASSAEPTAEDFAALRVIAAEDGFEPELVAELDPGSEGFVAEVWERGAIIAVAQLAEVFGPDDTVEEEHPMAGSPWVQDDAEYWLYFSDVVQIEPIPFEGADGMFEVPYEVAESLEPLVIEEDEE